ncbi:hypothetical protein KL86PLE_10230 [uncultured Pleomorphomonas sp.]|uniref:Uncharacterized protein n=1 Tax=uncultured Pleomorphomonas sp. TaxID=442121 RepID=A0A212KZC8_9HYPH|nr:hypothetical protein KL86PLE_10230 [uncultured Pleomorphomonas sp.]
MPLRIEYVVYTKKSGKAFRLMSVSGNSLPKSRDRRHSIDYDSRRRNGKRRAQAGRAAGSRNELDASLDADGFEKGLVVAHN